MVNRVLVVTGIASDGATIENVLGNASDGQFDIEWVTRLSDALAGC